MNPLLVSSSGISITANRACLTVSNTDNKYKFRTHQIPYDSIIIGGHYGNISFEAIRWLMKHDILVSVLNWNDNLLSTILPKEPLNGELKKKQYQKYHDKEERIRISSTVLGKKIRKSQNMLKELSEYYPEITMNVFQKELEFVSKDSLTDIMMHEGRIASSYWSEISKIFNQLYPDFHFETRKNKSYS